MSLKKFQQKIICNKTDNTNKWSSKVKHFLEKWNRVIAAIVGIVVFALLVAIVIYDIVSSSSLPEHMSQKFWFKSTQDIINSGRCKLTDQLVECENIPSGESLEEHINSLPIHLNEIGLRIEAVHINNNSTIQIGWLQNISAPLRSLIIIKCDVKDIEDGVFENYPFQNLRQVTFEDTTTSFLRRGSFRGLRANSFEFRFTSLTPVELEEGVLTAMQGYLQVLQFNMCGLQPQAILNLTYANGVYLNALQVVDFRYNDITELPERAFYNAPNIRSLYLYQTRLLRIHQNAFAQMQRLQLLQLNDNFLSTLESGTLNPFLYREIYIYLHNNRWNCTCELQWLKDVYLTQEIINKTTPLLCSSHNDAAFTMVEFCGDITESSNLTSETTEISTDVITHSDDTTPITARFVQINCTIQSPEIKFGDVHAADYLQTEILEINESSLKFDFYELDQEPVEIMVIITGDITNFHLFWFNSQLRSDYGCVTHMHNTVYLEGLQRNNTYTICLLYGNETTVSPHDCFGLTVRVAWPYRCFVINKWIGLLIGLSATALLFCTISSACIMFYCIRQNPRLIKGNKRVIIVGSKTADVIVMPKEYDRPEYVAPSINSYAQSSYMTPSYHQYAKVKYNYRPPILRSVSEESVLTNNLSYVNPLEPTSFQLHTWRRNVRQRPKLDDAIRSQNDYEIPPALPPLNKYPDRELCKEENPYSSV